MSEPTTNWLRILESTYPPPRLDLDAGWADVLNRAEVRDDFISPRSIAPQAASPLPHRWLAMLTRRHRRQGSLTRSHRPLGSLLRLHRPLGDLSLQHRPLGVALATLFTLMFSFTALAAAAVVIGGPLAGFREWLGIGPGKPAPPAVQRSFSKANAASVASFPSGTKLRLLIHRQLGGTRYQLLGFRAPGRLCLRLEVDRIGSAPACTPISALTATGELVHVLVAGQPLRATGQHLRADRRRVTVTYGFATDAVRHVEIVERRGAHPAQLAYDAFLYVSLDGKRPLGAIAIDESRNEVPIAVPATAGAVGPRTGWGFQPTPKLQRESSPGSQGALSWLLHRKPLGAPLPPAKILPLLPPHTRLLFARLISPDRRSPQDAGHAGPQSAGRALPQSAGQASALRVGVALVRRGGAGHASLQVCEVLYQPLSDGLAGCAPVHTLFADHYIVGRTLPSVAGGEGAVLVGLASPRVSQISSLPSGYEREVKVTPRHGVFAIQHPGSAFSPWLFISERTPAIAPRAGRRWGETEIEYGRWPPPQAR